jgi:hypothetical protein
VKTRLGGEGPGTSGALESQLSSWLRGFDPGEAPIRMRVRISANLRAETERRRNWRPWLARGMSSVTASIAVLIGAAPVILAATGSSVSTAGSPMSPLPGPAAPLTNAQAGGRLDLTGLAALLLVAGLVGALSCLPAIRRLARWVVGCDEQRAATRSLPRRFHDIPGRVVLLDLLAIVEIAWWYIAYGIPSDFSVLSLTVSLLLPVLLAPAIALRYSAADRSGRWLAIGSVSLAVQAIPGLVLATTGSWFDADWGQRLSTAFPFLEHSLTALGWFALALGIAARSGLARRPSWFVVVAGVAVVLCTQVSSAFNIASDLDVGGMGLPDDIRARLVWQVITMSLANLAWLSILWIALMRVRTESSDRSWKLALISGAAWTVLLVYFSLASAKWLPLFDFQVINYGEWIVLGALLLALLVGLNPVQTEQERPVEIPDQTS